MRRSMICLRRSLNAVRFSPPFSCNTSFIRHIIVIQISERVDALEASIQDIINDADALASSGSASSITQLPTPATTPTVQLRRTRGGLQ